MLDGSFWWLTGLLAGMAVCCVTGSAHPADESASRESPALTAAPSTEGRLVWADEFDRDGPPDPKRWGFETGFVRNDELQYYQPANARVRNGRLVIEGRRERIRNPRYEAASDDWRRNREFAEYTSASLTTRGLHQWRYGRFEMRARIDTRDGLWPAFWTLGVDGDWPRGGEIDIMEYYRGRILANVAWGTDRRWVAKWDSYSKAIADFGDPAWGRKFHTWVMDWDGESIRLFLDGVLLNETDLRRTINENDGKTNPFHQPHYLIVNLAIGGTNGGDPSKTRFPSRFEVDYIRVYQ